jgi:methionyl aminopeptidase
MVTRKSKKEIKILHQGGRLLAKILKQVANEIKPGVTTGHLEQLALELIKQAGGRPSFKGYKSRYDIKPYPTALCTSINDEVVHAPSLPSRRLKTGDIVSIDVGMEFPHKQGKQGYYTDMAVTLGVGKISKEAKSLINVTRKSLEHAIKEVKPGNTLNNIGDAIESYVIKHGFKVVRDLVGHGVGYDVHEDPHVPNYVINGKSFENIVLKPGMVLAIEPMVNVGGHEVISSNSDSFAIKTADGTLSAHFEHTVAVIEDGHLVLTKK